VRIGEVWKRHATRAGLTAALAALLLWPANAAMQGSLWLPFLAALLVMAASGVSILLVTANDILTVRRSRHARPARVFDLAFGLILAVPAGLGLAGLIG
jgi:fucose permease